MANSELSHDPAFNEQAKIGRLFAGTAALQEQQVLRQARTAFEGIERPVTGDPRVAAPFGRSKEEIVAAIPTCGNARRAAPAEK